MPTIHPFPQPSPPSIPFLLLRMFHPLSLSVNVCSRAEGGDRGTRLDGLVAGGGGDLGALGGVGAAVDLVPVALHRQELLARRHLPHLGGGRGGGR